MEINGLQNKQIKFKIRDKDNNEVIVEDYYYFEENGFHDNKDGGRYGNEKIISIIIGE